MNVHVKFVQIYTMALPLVVFCDLLYVAAPAVLYNLYSFSIEFISRSAVHNQIQIK